jgi:hypothetical protein
MSFASRYYSSEYGFSFLLSIGYVSMVWREILLYNLYVLKIFLPVVKMFMKEPALIPIVELMLILRGGVNKYMILFTLFNHSSFIMRNNNHI